MPDDSSTKSNSIDDVQNGLSGKGPGATFVDTRWIIGLLVYCVVVITTLFGLFYNAWPRCDVPMNTVSPPSVKLTNTGGTPSVTWISPQSGPVTGKESVTIIGSGFSKDSKVNIGGITVTSAGSTDGTSIAAQTPTHSPGIVDVIVATPGVGTATLVGGYAYLGTAPVISAVTPASVTVSGGSVVVDGTNFLSNAKVTFGGISAVAVTESSTLIRAAAPSHEPGKVDIVVYNIDGQRAAKTDALTYRCSTPSDQTMLIIVLLAGALGGALHGLRSFSWYVGNRKFVWSWMPMYLLLPFSGSGIGLLFYLIIRGGFYTPASTSTETSMIVIALTAMVGLFSEQAMQKLKTIAEAILTTTPPGANHAPPSVVASTPVTLSAIDQITGPRTGGQSVKIQGSGFAAGAKVSFGTVAATDVTVVSATVITAKTPPHDPGAVDVTVTNSDGQIASLKNAYTYI